MGGPGPHLRLILGVPGVRAGLKHFLFSLLKRPPRLARRGILLRTVALGVEHKLVSTCGHATERRDKRPNLFDEQGLVLDRFWAGLGPKAIANGPNTGPFTLDFGPKPVKTWSQTSP